MIFAFKLHASNPMTSISNMDVENKKRLPGTLAQTLCLGGKMWSGPLWERWIYAPRTVYRLLTDGDSREIFAALGDSDVRTI